MSKGPGRTQMAILAALAAKPLHWWSRVGLQMAIWGKHPDHALNSGHARVCYTSERSYRTVWRKNVAPVTDGRRNYEQNFTRALASLKSRGLIEIDAWGNILLTDAGRALACKAETALSHGKPGAA